MLERLLALEAIRGRAGYAALGGEELARIFCVARHLKRLSLNLLKGTDLSLYSQEKLDEIALELNMRPRKRFDFKCPIEVMSEQMAKYHEAPSSTH